MYGLQVKNKVLLLNLQLVCYEIFDKLHPSLHVYFPLITVAVGAGTTYRRTHYISEG